MRIRRVTQTNRGEVGPGFQKRLLVIAQLRDVVTAKESAVVAQKYDYGRAGFPERSETDPFSIRVGKFDFRQCGGHGVCHAGSLVDLDKPPVSLLKMSSFDRGISRQTGP